MKLSEIAIPVASRKLLAFLLVVLSMGAMRQAAPAEPEQFVPIMGYRVGPYAASGSALAGGYIDYLKLINERDGGVNGVKLAWEECETEYNNSRGIECYERLKSGSRRATWAIPLSTGIAYSLLDRVAPDKIPMITIGYGRTDAADGRVFPYVYPLITTYWSQAVGMINFIAKQEGGPDKLAGKKIVHLYHDSAYGKEPIPIFEELARRKGFELVAIPVQSPGVDQQAQWLRIRDIKPDWVILWGYGTMNPAALKTAGKVGFPRNRMLGVWWSGAEEDTVPAGEAATGFYSATYSVPGQDYPVIRDIISQVYDKNHGSVDRSRIGSVYYNRGVLTGIIAVEAIRKAQEHFGQRPLSGEEMQWGFDHLQISSARLSAIGAPDFMPTINITCSDHEGSGKVKFQQWTGNAWNVVSDWIESDHDFVRQRIEESAMRYSKEKGITPRDCR